MRTINIRDVKTHFSKLVDSILDGEEIIIAKAGKPVAKLVPISPKKPMRHFGILKGKIKIAEDFDAPFSNNILDDFEGK